MKACTGSIPVSGVDSCLERSEKLCGIAASLLRARHKTAADNSPRLFCLTRRQGAQIGRRASGELFVHAVLCSRREQATLGRTISELFLLCAHSGTNRSRRRRGLFVHTVLCSRREQASLGRTISELFLLCAHSGTNRSRRRRGLFVHTVLCSRREQASLGRTISELFLLCAHSGTNRSRRRRELFVHAVLCSRREQASLGRMPLRGLSAALLLQRFFALPLLRRQTVTSRHVPFSSA